MKHTLRCLSFLAPILFLCWYTAKSQVVLPEIQRNLMTHQSAYALTAGHYSFNGSTLTAGVVLKQYGKTIKPGARFQIQVPINDMFGFTTHGDMFPQAMARDADYEAKFLELATGLYLTFKGAQVSALWQAWDVNPVTNVVVKDGIVLKAGYRIKWNR